MSYQELPYLKKYSDRRARANSVDPDQLLEFCIWLRSILYTVYTVVVLDTLAGSEMDFINPL